MLSVIIQSKSKNSVFKFVNSLKLFGIGQSWGGFESLALYQKIQRIYKKYIKKNHHIVRLHIGLEDPSELIADLKQALKKINESNKVFSKQISFDHSFICLWDCGSFHGASSNLWFIF